MGHNVVDLFRCSTSARSSSNNLVKSCFRRKVELQMPRFARLLTYPQLLWLLYFVLREIVDRGVLCEVL